MASSSSSSTDLEDKHLKQDLRASLQKFTGTKRQDLEKDPKLVREAMQESQRLHEQCRKSVFGERDKVSDTSNTLLESKLFASVGAVNQSQASDLKNRVTNVGPDGKPFRASEFARKIGKFMRVEFSEDANKNELMQARPRHWDAYGKFVQSAFNRPPTYSYLIGSLEEVSKNEEKTRSPTKRRSERQQIKAPTTSVKNISNNELGGSQKFRNQLDHVYRCLKKRWRDNDKSPVNLYKFTIHPTDFSTTVENLFYLSHLVRENKVVFIDNTELGEEHELEPDVALQATNKEGVPVRLEDQNANGQKLLNFNMKDWRRFRDKYGIKEPWITPMPEVKK